MSFFDIKSIVVIGASENKGKIGNTIIKRLYHFSGESYGVNPKGGSYNNIVFYKNIEQLPIIPDVAVIVIKAKYVADSLDKLGSFGIKRIIIISAGFKEVGNKTGEDELKKIAKKYSLDLLGPNCLGYFDVCKNLDLSFGGKLVACGNVAIVSQSGAMAVALTDWAISKNLGISKIISMGNKAGIDENKILKLLEKDNKTKVIAIYLESIEHGEDFYRITKKLSKKIPIVLIKSGISERGSKAASSHTGALASKKEILDSAFKNAGLHSTHSVEDFFLWSYMFSNVQNEEISDEMIIITNAGGPGVMATDHIEFNNIKLAEFSKKEKQSLEKGLPKSSSIANPIDIVGDATSETYEQILQNISKLDKKRAILIILTAQNVTDVETIAQKIVEFKKTNPKALLFVSFMGGEDVEAGRNILKDNSILEYDYPRKAIIAYKELLKQKAWQQKPILKVEAEAKPSKIILKNLKQKIEQEKDLVGNILANEILKVYNINYAKELLAEKKEDVGKIYKKMEDKTLISKIVSPDIAHKSDIGGVVLNIKTKNEAIKAYDNILKNVEKNIPKARIHGISFSEMIQKNNSSKEIFVGFKRDKSFGKIMLLGMGGLYVNVFEDISMRIGLVTKDEIMNMFKELKIFKILNGARGEKAVNFEKLIDNIYKLQFIFRDFEEIKEIDINPIIVDEKIATIVDTKFYL